MKIRHLLLGLAAVAALTLGGVANAQVTLPQVQVINPTDLFQDIPRGVPSAGNQYASALQLSAFGDSMARTNNVLIGGDAGTNLFQRATTGASQTTTVAYGGPDRWAYWSGTNTAMTVSRDTTAADLPASNYQAAFKMARTSGQTGVVQVCMVQEVETVNAIQFQGQTAELDFHATAGANFSAASSTLNAYIVYGTGTDEGVSKLAFAFNAGGGGSSTWAGQTNATVGAVAISTVPNRYAVVAAIPTTATEIGVIFCFTPVGTAGTNDYVALSGIQLVRNAALTAKASATVGYTCATDIVCTSFDRRLQGTEANLQYRYFYKIAESAAITPIASCGNSTTSLALCLVPFPVPMRAAPTMTYTAGFAANTTTAMTAVSACTALATSTAVTSTAANVSGVMVGCTSSAAFGAAGTTSFLYSNNGSGVINATAEL